MPCGNGRRRRTAQNIKDPPTPHPRMQERFLAPRIGERCSPTSLSPATPAAEEPVTLPINRAGPGEPLFIAVTRPETEPVYQFPQAQPREWIHREFRPVIERTTNSKANHNISIQAQELHCHYPEKIYLSSVLPMRTPRELREFQRHCRDKHDRQSGLEVIYSHSLYDLREITTSPLNFQNLLYRTCIILTSSGIIEIYAYIKRNPRAQSTDRAYLEPAYKVSYTWATNSWVTT